MIGTVNRVTDRLADRMLANTRSRIDDPPRARRLFRRDVAFAVVVLLCWSSVNVVPPPWGTLCSVVVGVALGLCALPTSRRALAYEDGYLRGRIQLVGSLSEAGRRGMSLDEWLHAELLRDLAVIGVEPHSSGPRDDDDCGGI